MPKKIYGLLGERLSHSFSPQIHKIFADYDYKLFEVPPSGLKDFISSGGFAGLNVTIPYKKAVIPYCAQLSNTAEEIGSVNTLLARDGKIFGDNTDAYGFDYLLKSNNFSVKGKKALVLGSGGASLTAVNVLKKNRASSIVVISRGGPDNYETLPRRRDAEIIINATPVGMYPNNGVSPIDLTEFTSCGAVIDLIYNPRETALIQAARRLKIPYANGLAMLAAQAKRAAELFTGADIDDDKIDKATKKTGFSAYNILFVGMPGCGKSTIAKILAEKTNRDFIDTDILVEKAAGMSIPEIFKASGERGFRQFENSVLKRLSAQSGKAIASGGGIVTLPENLALLRQNSIVIFINRSIELLSAFGRPLSKSREALESMFSVRLPLYKSICDYEIANNGALEDAVDALFTLLN